MENVEEIVFQVETCDESGVLVASWDAPEGGGITTQSKDLRELQEQVTDAVRCHFDAGKVPRKESRPQMNADKRGLKTTVLSAFIRINPRPK